MGTRNVVTAVHSKIDLPRRCIRLVHLMLGTILQESCD